ncbi:hypothetical protein AWZ03_012029 [Drosophila navojoa]|uniref:Sugar transporter SWEET n=1 Tax=Drosophila navojoa TaxID=7232 RepID=A0A484AYP1_DRONA|nr:uncharacterized protein LOC115564367 [Drosophila navojoa]TDG41543.1 hypothetical protein AWZ03_012029 [Drosophila navojoa]
MEFISGFLKPHREKLRYFALMLSCVKLFRGLGLLFRVRANSDTSDSISTKPLLGALLMSTLGMRLAQLNHDQTMLAVHSASLVLNVTYLIIFYHYAPPERKIRIVLKTMIISLLIIICLIYSFLGDRANVKRDLSIIMTSTTSLLILLGLLHRTGCLGCLISILVVSSKMLYALSTMNRFNLYQSLVVFCLDVARIAFLLLNTTYEGDDCCCNNGNWSK